MPKSARKRASSPRRKASSPRRKASSPRKRASSPRKRASSPRRSKTKSRSKANAKPKSKYAKTSRKDGKGRVVYARRDGTGGDYVKRRSKDGAMVFRKASASASASAARKQRGGVFGMTNTGFPIGKSNTQQEYPYIPRPNFDIYQGDKGTVYKSKPETEERDLFLRYARERAGNTHLTRKEFNEGLKQNKYNFTEDEIETYFKNQNRVLTRILQQKTIGYKDEDLDAYGDPRR